MSSMKFINSFVWSFDPFHSWHLQTWTNSEKELGPTQIVVCRNDTKSEWWLNLEQRRLDIIYTLLLSDTFDSSKRDPEEIVTIANSLEDIASVFAWSDKVVRGVRWPEDIAYNELLMQKTRLDKIAKEKGHYINVPESHIDVSSTSNKIVLQSFLKESWYIPTVYRKLFWHNVYNKIMQTDFPWQSRDIKWETRNKIQNNIETYFSKLERL